MCEIWLKRGWEGLWCLCVHVFFVDLEGVVVLILPRREHGSWGGPQNLGTQSSHHFGIKMTKTPPDCNMACNFPTGNATSQKLLANILLILACLASHFLLLNRILRLLLVALEASFLVASISIFVGKVNVYHVLPTYSNHIPIFTIFYQHIPSIFQSFPIIDIHFLILSSYAEFHSHEGYPSWIAWGLGDRPPKLGGAQWLGGAFVLE